MSENDIIYVFRPGALGDILIASPLFYTIKLRYPKSKLILISEEGMRLNHVTSKMVSELIPEIDYTILYPNSSVINKFYFFRNNIKFSSKNCIVYLNYSRCSAMHVVRDFLFFKLLGFRKTYSFYNYIKSSYTSKKNFIPEFQRLFNITKDLTGSNSIPTDFILNQTKISKTNKLKIFAAPFGKARSKRWPIERFFKLFDELGLLGFSIVVCGSKDEEQEFKDIGWDNKLYMTGYFGLPLKDLVDKIKDSVLYIGNDTGPMHLAALINIPCIALFSDTNRETNWTPFGSGHDIIRVPVECGNCLSEICLNKIHLCMDMISYEQVHLKVMIKLFGNG